jgi:hypothetical protein
MCKCTGNFDPGSAHKATEVESKYNSTVSLTSALDEGGWSTPLPGVFTPQERPGTHCTGGWMGPRANVRVRKIWPLTGIWFPDRPVRSKSPYWLLLSLQISCVQSTSLSFYDPALVTRCSFKILYTSLSLQVCVLYSSRSKQRLFAYIATEWTDWVL